MKFSDPNRFNVRGYSSLFESKERKRLETDLSKLETSLAKEAHTFKEIENFEFTIDDKPIATYIKDTKGLYQQEKEQKKKQRVSRQF